MDIKHSNIDINFNLFIIFAALSIYGLIAVINIV